MPARTFSTAPAWSFGSGGFGSWHDPIPSTRAAPMSARLAREGAELHFAQLKGTVKDRLKGNGIYARLGDAAFHPTVGTAVRAYLFGHPVPWVDWDDEAGSRGTSPR